MVEVQCSGCIIPFRHLPHVWPELLEFHSYGSGSIQAQALQEVDKMLEKGTLDLVDYPGVGYQSRLPLMQKAIWGRGGGDGWLPVIDLLSLNRYVTHQIKRGDSLIGTGVN